MKQSSLAVLLMVVGVIGWSLMPSGTPKGFTQETPPGKQQANSAPQTSPVQKAKQSPSPKEKLLVPLPFTAQDGKRKGWKIIFPDYRPLATPAVADGKVFLGGGFGSHEFYAFDAVTGRKAWKYVTQDDGPTAAVIQDSWVAFNTESCELEIITIAGKRVWKKWLGDPLMSMPAIDNGKIYMAYPNSKGDHRHYLACFDLKTGSEFWKKPIAGDIITTPVVTAERVYLTTLEGSLYCFGQQDGELLWMEKRNATSSPAVWRTRCYFSRREEVTQIKGGQKLKQQTEQLATRGLGVKDDLSDLVATARSADYLDFEKRVNSPREWANQMQDEKVGFGLAGFGGGGLGGGFGGGGLSGGFGGGLSGGALGKGDAKILQGVRNLGQASVLGIWSYQGSKPFVYKDHLYNAMGDTLQCVDPRTGKIVWKKTLHSKKDKGKGKVRKELLDCVLTPPALVNDKAFIGTTDGDVMCLSSRSGEVLWTVTLGEPVVFQPAVAKGRVYVSTGSGSLYCLETGDANDDGWLMWGGNAAHNGLLK